MCTVCGCSEGNVSIDGKPGGVKYPYRPRGGHTHHGHDHDHGHHHHHDHDADDVFTSWGRETVKKYTRAELEFALNSLDDGEFGAVLRAKGIVAGDEGKWIHFDHVPGEADVRNSGAGVTGRLCVIGAKLDEQALAQLFLLA